MLQVPQSVPLAIARQHGLLWPRPWISYSKVGSGQVKERAQPFDTRVGKLREALYNAIPLPFRYSTARSMSSTSTAIIR